MIFMLPWSVRGTVTNSFCRRVKGGGYPNCISRRPSSSITAAAHFPRCCIPRLSQARHEGVFLAASSISSSMRSGYRRT